MKKIVLGILAITLTISAMAQTADGGTKMEKSERKEGKHNRMKGGMSYDKLDLTDDQKAQLKTIDQDFKQQMRDLHKEGNITVDEQKQKREALIKARKEKMDAVLSPEQRKQVAGMAADFGGKGRRQGGDLDRITKNLNLTADQTTKINSLNAAFKKQLQEIRQNTSLQEDEKRSQVKNLMKQHRSDMEALLTNEQKEQLKRQQKNKPNREAVK